jgi:dUTP pyrophosphatase
MSSIKWHTEDERLLPERATKNSVGYDFKAPNKITIAPKETVIIDSLVACDFSNDLWLGIYGRSSFATKRLINPLGVGVIDSDYFATGNTIKIALLNIGYEEITIEKGEAIAQGIFHSVNIGDDIVTTERIGGFGSTDFKDEYQLTVEINGKKHKAKYCKYAFGGSDKYLYGIFVSVGYHDSVFICKDEKLSLHGGSSLFGNLDFLKNHCWYVAEHSVVDCTKEEATNDFIESLIVKEG